MIKSPCVRKCGLNKHYYCGACGMTVRDLRVWSNCNEEEKQKIVKESRLRVSVPPLRDKGFPDRE